MSSRHEKLRTLLAAGNTVSWREGGNSMRPRIRHREEVTIAPVRPDALDIDDIVFARVRGRYWLHKISAIDGNRVQIANNRGHVNGWTNRDRVFGIVIVIGGVPIPGAAAKVSKR